MVVVRVRPGWEWQGSCLVPGKPPLQVLYESYGFFGTQERYNYRRNGGWMDHLYRGFLLRGKVETPIWVSEPYGVVDTERDFSTLRLAGFVVELNPKGFKRRWDGKVAVVLIRRTSDWRPAKHA